MKTKCNLKNVTIKEMPTSAKTKMQSRHVKEPSAELTNKDSRQQRFRPTKIYASKCLRRQKGDQALRSTSLTLTSSLSLLRFLVEGSSGDSARLRFPSPPLGAPFTGFSLSAASSFSSFSSISSGSSNVLISVSSSVSSAAMKSGSSASSSSRAKYSTW